MTARSEFIQNLKTHFATFAICVVGVVTSATGTWAQTSASGELIPLTPEIVGNYVEGYPPVRDRLDALSEELGVADSDSSADNMAAFMAHEKATSELDVIVAQYGFENYVEWVNTTASVVAAYTFVGEGGGLDAQMQAFIQQIEDNENMSDEQKQAMIDQLSGPMQAITANRPDQASLDAVAPYTAELEELFGDI